MAITKCFKSFQHLWFWKQTTVGEQREGSRAEVMSLILHYLCGLCTSEEIQHDSNSKCGAETLGLCWKREKETNRSDLEDKKQCFPFISDHKCRCRNIPVEKQELHLDNNVNHRAASWSGIISVTQLKIYLLHLNFHIQTQTQCSFSSTW